MFLDIIWCGFLDSIAFKSVSATLCINNLPAPKPQTFLLVDLGYH